MPKIQRSAAEEREAVEAGLPNPLPGIDVRSSNYLYDRKPKKLKEGRTKYNQSKVEEVERRILEVSVAKKSGSFESHRERDVLTKALGNPENRGHVRGVSSGKS